MPQGKRKHTQSPNDEILDMLSRLQSGDFSKRLLETPDNASLAPIIKSINALADSYQAQARELAKTREHDRQMMTLLDKVPSMIGYWNAELRNNHANSAYTTFFGKKPEEIRGKHMQEVLGEALFQKNLPFITGALQGQTQSFEREILMPDRSGTKYTMSKYIPDIQGGQVLGFYVIVTDISEIIRREKDIQVAINTDLAHQKEANLEKEELTKFLDLVLNNVPSMIFVKDCRKNMAFSLFNKAAEDLIGVKKDQLIGKNDHDIFPKDQADFFAQKDREVFDNARILKIEKEEIETKNGKRYLRTFKVPTFDIQGRPQLLIGISNDITDEVHTKEALELERIKSTQNAKLASLGEMSAGIAHEINNPLAIIHGTAQSLPKFLNNPEKLHAKFKTIIAASERIEKIVKGLKKFSRSSEKTELSRHVLSAIVNESLTLTEAKSKNCDTPIMFKCSFTGEILCDEIEIEQVLINLINNAIDAVKILEERWVKIDLFETEEGIALQVRDSGKGLSPDVEKKLFQPFFTTKPVGQGTGLGLSIVKGILDEHNATIELLSQDANTCFELRFPKIS